MGVFILQISLFDTRQYEDFDLPDYKKVYSVYAYDKIKAHKFYKQKKEEAKKAKNPDIYNSINPYDVIQKFIIRNKDGTKKHLKDQKHIFRLKALNLIYEELGKKLIKSQDFSYYDNQEFNFKGIKIYYDYYPQEKYEYRTSREGWKNFKGEEFNNISAELDGTQQMSIYKRLKIHIYLLKCLRSGLDIEETVLKTKERFEEWIKQ
jgi:hypothetical protein